MAGKIDRLNALTVKRAMAPGLYADGAGLYLQVTASGARSWIFRFRWHGGRRDMGLGSLDAVPLAKARQKAAEARQALADSIDPIAARNAAKAAETAELAKSKTFKDAANDYISARKAAWTNPKHAAQWESTLATYAYPIIEKLAVGDIDVGHVTRILRPIWAEKPETARRLRGRIEAILDSAKAHGWRTGDNPARWRESLKSIFPAYTELSSVEHHPALPYSEIGAFVAELRKQAGVAPRALEFLILTATRTSETTGARWSEIDMAKGEWRIPKERMKTRKKMKGPHRVPLSARSLEILRDMSRGRTGEFVFPSRKRDKHLSNGAFLAVLDRMGRGDITAHGFRSTFRDWAAEQTNYPRDVAEMALAHAIGDKVEAAYRRGDLFAKRARMMADWAKHCDTVAKAGNVVAIGVAR
jgi:integrase